MVYEYPGDTIGQARRHDRTMLLAVREAVPVARLAGLITHNVGR